MKVDTNKEQFEQGLFALQKELVELVKNTKKERINKTNIFILKAWEHFQKYGDSSIFKKLFFFKVGNTILYNKLSLKDYFEACNIAFIYNVKKDSLKIAYLEDGVKDKPLKITFKDFKDIKEPLTPEQKEKAFFERVFNSIKDDKDKYERLKAYLKESIN